MKVSAVLEKIRRLPVVSVDHITNGRPAVIISPHPDDESLGAGGLIAATRACGRSVDVVVLTDGSRSHPNSKLYDARRLSDLRRREMYKAATSLGLAHCNVHHLNQRDTQAPRSGPEFEAAIRFVSELVKNRGAESLFCTWRHDPHCDHQAASDLANRAAAISPGIKQWAYPIWGWHLPPEDDLPGSPSGVRINIAAHIKKKRAAISAHRSQVTHLIEDDPTGFYFTKERLSPFIGKYEYFLEVVS